VVEKLVSISSVMAALLAPDPPEEPPEECFVLEVELELLVELALLAALLNVTVESCGPDADDALAVEAVAAFVEEAAPGFNTVRLEELFVSKVTNIVPPP